MAQPTQLTPTEQDALVKQIGLAMLRVAPDDWERLTVDYRAVGRYAESTAEVTFSDGGTDSWEMPADLRALFTRLRGGMYREGRGTWFNARYRLDHPSSYNLEYDREEPVWDMPPPPQAYPDDLRLFPRTDENVPEWLRRWLASAPPPPGAPPGPAGGPPPGGPGPERPRFRVARIFDGPGEDGRPSVNRPPVDEMDIQELLDYLDGGPLVGPARGYDVDRLDPNGQQSVPIAFHTDGTWIWPAAVNYFLREHDISPETDLVDHVRRMRFKLPQVDEQTRAAAQLFLGPPPGPPGPGPGPGPRPGPPAPAPTRALPVPAPAPTPAPPRAALPSQGPPNQQVDQLRTRLDDLDVPETAYRIGPPAGRGWVMEQTDEGWRVGWYDRDWVAPAMFEDVADASAFLLGKLLLDTDRWAAGPKNPELPPMASPSPLAPEDHGFEPLSAPMEAFEPMAAPIEEYVAASEFTPPGRPAPAGPVKPPPGTPGYSDPPGRYGDSPGFTEPPAYEPPGAPARSNGYDDAPVRTSGYDDSQSRSGGYREPGGYGDSPGFTEPSGAPGYADSPGFSPPRPGPPPGTPPRPQPTPTMAMDPSSLDVDPQGRGHDSGRELDSPGRGHDAPNRGLDLPARGMDAPAHGLDSAGRELDSPGHSAGRGLDSPSHGLDAPGRGYDAPSHGLDSPGRGLDSAGRGPDAPSHGLDSPGRSHEAPSHGLDSPSRSHDAPSHGLGSPSHGFDSPGRSHDAPSHGLDSSGRGHDSAGHSLDSPGRGLDSAGRGLDSPGHSLDSPGRGPDSPGRGPDSAGRGLDSSGRGLDSPGRGLDTPSRGLDSPGHGLDSPGRGHDAPGRGHDAPSHGLDSPPRGSDSPGRGLDSPPRGVEAPGRGGDQATVLASRPMNGAATAPAGAEWPITPLPGEPPLTLFRGKRVIELEPGMEIDRFGEDDGNLVYVAGTPFSERSLVPEWVDRPYHAYRVRQPVQVLTGAAIPWFDQPGGGTAFLLPDAVGELLAHGQLVEINDRERPPA